MIRVVTEAAPAQPTPAELVVRVGAVAPGPGEAGVVVRVADAARAAVITSGVVAALDALPPAPPAGRVVRLRARAAIARLAARLPGAVTVVAVTPRNARHLVALIDGVRAAGAVGVQLVWDGAERARVERHVFAALEHARATPGAAPVVLAPVPTPVAALQILVAHRRQR